MRVLILQDSNWYKSNPMQQFHLGERLAKRGHDVVYFCTELTREKSRKVIFSTRFKIEKSMTIDSQKIGVLLPPYLNLPIIFHFSYPLFIFIALLRFMKAYKPHIVCNWGIVVGFIGLISSKITKTIFLHYTIDRLYKMTKMKVIERPLMELERLLITFSDYNFVISHGLMVYVKSLAYKKRKIHILPGGVDVKGYQKPHFRERYRSIYNLKQEEVCLFYMGWIYEFSGIIEVAKLICTSNENNPFKLLVVGDGDVMEELKTISKSCTKIILTGQVPFSEIRKIIQAADICLLPAYPNELMSNVVPIKMYEYLAARKPVISSKLAGVYHEFKENNGVVYIESYNEFMDTINNILHNYKKHIRDAEQFIRKYDWDFLVNEFENSLKSIISKRTKEELWV
ncbi:MAG: glycosyltransferase [Candidatus Hodarchaeota archaeon]